MSNDERTFPHSRQKQKRLKMLRAAATVFTLLVVCLPVVTSSSNTPSIPAASPNFEAAFQGECGSSSSNARNNGSSRNGANNVSSNPCEHICLDLHDGTYECSCFYGFTLAVDGYSCAPLQVQTATPPPSPSIVDVASGAEEGDTLAPADTITKASGRRAAGAAAAAEPLAANDRRKLADGSGRATRAGSGRERRQGEVKSPVGRSRDDDSGRESPQTGSTGTTTKMTNAATNGDEKNDARGVERRPRGGRNKEAAEQEVGRTSSSLDEEDDKRRLSYDVMMDQQQQQERNGLEEGQADPDIRSIMAANDKLVRQLATRVASQSDSSSWLRQQSQRQRQRQRRRRRRRKENAEDYQLERLAKLVGKTMTGEQEEEEDNRLQATTVVAAAAAAAANQSYSSNQANNQIPSNNNSNRRFVHGTCNDMPGECESGGQCFVENADDDDDDNDMEQRRRRRRRRDNKTRARCRCPIGRGGLLCQKPIQREVPKFLGHSYLTLPLPANSRLASMRLLFKPDEYVSIPVDSRAGDKRTLLLYSSEFVLSLLQDAYMSRLELQYLDGADGSVTRVLGSRDVEAGEWNELLVIDSANDMSDVSPDDENNISPNNSLDSGGDEDCDPSGQQANAPRIILVTPNKIGGGPRDHRRKGTTGGQLFVAGLPESMRSQQGGRAVPPAGGFRGCIRELSINGRRYNFRSDLYGDTLDGFDVVECCANFDNL